jgi:hypothetical protein
MNVHSCLGGVLFCTTGGLRHLLPQRPLTAALRSRRHTVAWVIGPDALPRVKGLGRELFAATFEASRCRFRAAHADAAQLAGGRLSAFTLPASFAAALSRVLFSGLLSGSLKKLAQEMASIPDDACGSPPLKRWQKRDQTECR